MRPLSKHTHKQHTGQINQRAVNMMIQKFEHNVYMYRLITGSTSNEARLRQNADKKDSSSIES